MLIFINCEFQMLRRSTRKRAPSVRNAGNAAAAAKKAKETMTTRRNINTTRNQEPMVTAMFPPPRNEHTYNTIYSNAQISPVAVITSTGTCTTQDTAVMVPTVQTVPNTAVSVSTGNGRQEPFLPTNIYSGNAPTGTSINYDFQNTCNPCEVTKASDDIARNIPLSTKQKIIAGEYVDLASLLSNSQNTSTLGQNITFSQGQLIVQPKQPDLKINNIETWSDAFIVYISIYCSVHQGRFQELLKYMQIIRLGAKRTQGLNWKNYDEQFRLRKFQNPSSSWADIDTELWLLYMQVPGNTFPIHGNAPNPKYSQNAGGLLKCYAFNYQGSCTQTSCVYKHTCLRCNGSHPVATCFVYSKQSLPSNPQSPGIASGFRSRPPVLKGQSMPPFRYNPRQNQGPSRFRAAATALGQRQNPSQY